MGQMESIIGIAAGICTGTASLPQLVKMIKEKKAGDISVFMLVILIAGLSLWTWYGVLKTDLPIIITNGFSLVINLLILGLKWYLPRE